MSKDDMMIMAVSVSELFKDKYFEGFSKADEHDYESIIVNNYKWLRRGDAEVDPGHKQPIPYAMVVNPDLKKIFLYQRSCSDKKCDENRLMGKYGCGIGGHIDKNEADVEDALHSAMLRELEEEVFIDGSKKPKVLGYINYDSDEVGKVHIGILYLIETDALEVKATDMELENGQFVEFSEFEKIILNPDNEVEAWTKIALEPLKEYFNKL